MSLLGSDPGHRDRPIRTGRRDRPIIQLPSVALRVAVIVGVAVVIFGIVFFRLWYLQILNSQEFLAEAKAHSLRSVKVVAARGSIVDRHGEVIVENRPGLSVGIRLMDVPEGTLFAELDRLAPHLHMKPQELRRRIREHLLPSTWEQQEDGTWKSFFKWKDVVSGDLTGVDLIILKEDVSKRVNSYLQEHTLSFPGVEIQDDYLRSYPQGTMATQVLGHLQEISAAQLKTRHFKANEPGDVVGVDGLEYTYDRYLRGRDGVAKIEVDSSGRPTGSDPVGGRMPEAGDTLVTTLDSKVQKAAENALLKGVSLAAGNGANGGAAIAMNVKNGDVLAMASYPTYDPDVWVGGISTKNWKKLNNKYANNPMLNRPIMEAKAVGSTFKAITAVAGLEEGVITSGTTFYCPGYYISPNDGSHHKFPCFLTSGHGHLALVSAIAQSCDVYFYNVGNAFYVRGGSALQDWAKRLGMGKSTGIDIPSEVSGRVPTRAWKKSYPLFKTEIQQMWMPGDSINLSVGQGFLEATPLQLATAYAAIANGGKVVTPHLGLKLTDTVGRTVRNLKPTASRKVDVSQGTLDVVRQGLYEAAQNGTSAGTFAGYGVTVAGKTGTAEVWDSTAGGYVDYAWYASYAPASDPKYVVVVMIEKGGHGATTAAPAARMIYDALFHLKSGAISGTSQGD